MFDLKLLTRYILREYMIPFVYCLGGFISIYVLFELFGSFSRLLAAKLPFSMVVSYFCAYLAPYFEWLVPAALMLAALYTLWNFCRHSELIAMRANGVSFFSIASPILFVALLAGGVVWWVNDCYVPRKAQWARIMKTEQFKLDRVERADGIVYRNSRDNRTWTVDSFSDNQGRHLRGVRIVEDRPSGSRLYNITAEKADYLDGEWWLSNIKVQHFDSSGMEVPSPMPELDALQFRSFSHFREKPTDLIMQNRDWAYNSIRERLRFLRTHSDLTERSRRKFEYDVWAKILSPFAGFIITLLAIPAGVVSGRQSVFRGILWALFMFFGFYALCIGCMIGANSGWLPVSVAALTPYVLFLALGIRSFLRNR